MFLPVGHDDLMTQAIFLQAALATFLILLFVMGWQRQPVKSAFGPAVIGAIIATALLLFSVSFDGFALMWALPTLASMVAYGLAAFGLGRAMRWLSNFIRQSR